MFLFAAAFFGGLLLVPTYFQEVRGESTLHAGLLVAPQGIGAMITMPMAGSQVDKRPIGRIVPFGLVFILIGMFGLTQLTATTPYPVIITELFVMGLGMGATMMPLFTSALKTLKAHEVARGSTLLNINQQIASSVGVAVMSVLLTNHLQASKLAGPAMASLHDPALAAKIPAAAIVEGPRGRSPRLRPDLLGGVGDGAAHAHPSTDAASQARGDTPARRRGHPARHRPLTGPRPLARAKRWTATRPGAGTHRESGSSPR